jgi:2'-5' RNA ligase
VDTVTGNIDQLLSYAHDGRGLWIGLMPSADPIAGVDALDPDPHVTLAHLGKRSRSTSFVLRALGAVANIAATACPIKGEVFGVARFTDRGSKHEGDPIVLLIEGRDLLKLRAEFADKLSDLAPWLRGDPWIPHLTIGRKPSDTPHDPLRVELAVVTFDAIALVCGDARVTFQLDTQQQMGKVERESISKGPRTVASVPWKEVRGKPPAGSPEPGQAGLPFAPRVTGEGA